MPHAKITGKGKGAALMRDVTGTALILRALKKALSVPFTVKIRGGWDDEHLNAVEVAQMAEAEGVDAITVHPRTRSQRFTGRPRGRSSRTWWRPCAFPSPAMATCARWPRLAGWSPRRAASP
jgi:tRNA-dihydrouridine synthase